MIRARTFPRARLRRAARPRGGPPRARHRRYRDRRARSRCGARGDRAHVTRRTSPGCSGGRGRGAVATAPASSPAPRFAAPEAASQVAATPAGGLGEVTFALLLVLAAIFGVAWLVRRMRSLGGAGTQGIEILAQVALGARERAVVVKVGDERLLIGVAPGRVSTLHVLPRDAQLPPAPASGPTGTASPGQSPSLPANFAALLKKSLGR
jgi:flagellar protein FliO/FliZ